MPLAIETVIIVIVIVSFTVLCAVIFALYWLWRLLLEDRRCSRMENGTSWPPHVPQESGYTPIVPSTATETPPIHRCVCNTAEATDAPVSRPIVFPRILRPFNIIIDERKRRSVSAKRSNWNSRRPTEHLPVPTTPEAQEVAAIAEVLVLDEIQLSERKAFREKKWSYRNVPSHIFQRIFSSIIPIHNAAMFQWTLRDNKAKGTEPPPPYEEIC